MFNSPLILDSSSPEAMAITRACGMGVGPSNLSARLVPGGAVGFGSYQRQDEGPGKGVAYVALTGIVGRSPMFSSFGPFMGGTHTDDFIAGLDAAAADGSVRAIVIRVDSPGGLVDGVTEAVRAVRRAKAVKPVLALATRALSLGYWIGCQADELLGVATSRFGSLGVAQQFEDTSAMAAKAGVKVVGVATHEHKLDMTPGMPISDEALARRREECEALNLLFIADVAQARNVSDDVVRGWAATACYVGQDGVRAGLVDAIIDADRVEARALALADAREAQTKTSGAKRPGSGSENRPTTNQSTSPTAVSAGGIVSTPPTPRSPGSATGVTAMGFDPLKMQKDDPEGYAQARSHFKATFETEQKVEEEKPKAAATAVAAGTTAPVAASFGELDAAIGKSVPNRDALIARAQREKMGVSQAMAAAQDEMAGRLTALETAQKNAGLLGGTGTGTAPVAGAAGATGTGTPGDFIGAAQALARAEKIPLDDAMSQVAEKQPAVYAAYLEGLKPVARR